MVKIADDNRLIQAKEITRNILDKGEVEGVLALRVSDRHVEPYLFTESEEIDALDISGRYAKNNTDLHIRLRRQWL